MARILSNGDITYPSSWVVSLAAIFAALSAASGVIGIGLMLFAWRSLHLSPVLFLVPLIVAAYLTAAWMLENDRWQGGVFLSALYLYGLVGEEMSVRRPRAFGFMISVIELTTAVAATVILRKYVAGKTGKAAAFPQS
jgi:hypothetical protein